MKKKTTKQNWVFILAILFVVRKHIKPRNKRGIRKSKRVNDKYETITLKRQQTNIQLNEMKWDAEDKYFPFRISWKNLITWFHENSGYRLSAMNDKLETNTVLLEQLAQRTMKYISQLERQKKEQ